MNWLIPKYTDMATYTHFAKQPDVLKHLILCEVLKNETPQVYVETNSACAIYPMKQTPEQQYGIYHFLEKADEVPSLKDSVYYQQESGEMAKGNYLGSPALAMNVLGKQAKRFVFFDLEKSALENVGTYAKQIGSSASVEIHHADSSRGTIELLPSLPTSSFIHIDPYEIDKKGDSGVTYLDVLIQATLLGMKCLLWYGFMTGDDKASLDNYITSSLEKAGIKDYTGVELTMNSIRKDSVLCNPGILGSGILATNLSQTSTDIILGYSNQLVDIYKDAKYKDYDGSLYIQHL
jgi:23S rRNA (adenine2030-N6)-methyltransferase